MENVQSDSTKILGFGRAGDMKSACMEFEPGDVLYGRLRPYLNKVCSPSIGGLASAEFITFRDFEAIYPGFLKYLLNQPEFVTFANRLNEGDRPRVKWSQIQTFEFPLPPFDQQQGIVEAIEEQFSRLDAGVESLQRAKRNLTRLRGAAVRSLVDATWPTVSLGNAGDVVGGITKDSQRESRSDAIEIPYLRVANVQRGYLDLSEVKTIRAPAAKIKTLLLEPGDVLLTEGGDRDKLGRGWVWRGELDRCIHQNHIFRARLDRTRFIPEFVSVYANHFGQQWFDRMGKQTTNLASISLTNLRKFPVPAPSIEDQERVLAEVERQFSIIDAMAKTIDAGLQRAGALRQSILSQAFSGRLTGTT
ncbi:hypothetical protein BH18ACT6_BH18ACT6_21970 [soil metagenome]